MTLENILANFQLLDDWEDRYRYVIELGRALPPLPEAERTAANKVRGCASQVWLATEVNGATAGAAPRLNFKGDSDAHIVRGLIAILFAIYSGRCADEIVRDRCGWHVPAFRVGRALDAAALKRVRLDGRADPHRRPPRHEQSGEGGLSRAPHRPPSLLLRPRHHGTCCRRICRTG